MKALITGATGFIGRHLVKALVEQGYEVSCLIRKTSNIANLQGLSVKFIPGDLTEPESLYKAVSGVDFVYHLAIASYPVVDTSTYYQVNHIGTENIIRACLDENPKIKKFIYVSSLAAAGFSLEGKPLKETDAPHPVTHYGKSKLKGEDVVLQFKDKLPAVVMRPPTVYGAENLFFRYIVNIIKSGINLSWGGHTSLCFIDDFVRGLILVGESPESQGEVYFISDGNAYSWKQISDTIRASLETRPIINVYIPHIFIFLASFVMPSACRMFKKPSLGYKMIELRYPYWICDTSKINKQLKFYCNFDLKEGIDLTIKSLATEYIKPRISRYIDEI